MSGKKNKIALFVAGFPTTTFINRLAIALVDEGLEVYLVGKQKQKYIPPHPKLKIVRFYIGITGTVFVLLQVLRLNFFYNERYEAIKLQHGPIFRDKLAFLRWKRTVPVVLQLPDLFHVQWAAHVEEWLFLKQLGVKLVVSLRGTQINVSPLLDDELRIKYKNVFPQYDAFHAVSNAIRDRSIQLGISLEKTKTIYSGVLTQSDVSQEKEVFESRLKILCVGRMEWIKGYNYLFDTVSILRRDHHLQFRVTLIAQGRMPEELLYQLHDLDLLDNVHWINGISSDKVLSVMKEHDLLILPSVEEGIANVVLEAMSVGLPVISTDCGGMSEVIKNGYNGWLVPVRDVDVLVDAIIKFSCLNKNQITSIRDNAHFTIREKFNQADMGRQFAEFYKSVLCV